MNPTPIPPHHPRSDTIDPTELVVLLVDDAPDNLAMLHDALDAAGYTVLVALDGASALERAQTAQPDVILLDAIMPGMDGFAVARALQADDDTAHIPIVFMTGLTETEHLVQALATGAVDYVTKPAKPAEVMARIGTHVQNARRRRQTERQQSQARNALDAFGYASIMVRVRDGRLLWQTPLARDLLLRYCATEAPITPQPILEWLQRHLDDARRHIEPPRLRLHAGERKLTLRLHRRLDDDGAEGDASDPGDWLIVMEEACDEAAMEALAQGFGLTAREAEVLYWVAQGKINRDIADIVGASPGTVKKHLERIHAKLGVETRTAAAAMALQRMRELPRR